MNKLDITQEMMMINAELCEVNTKIIVYLMRGDDTKQLERLKAELSDELLIKKYQYI